MVSALARHDVPCCPFVPLDQRQMPIVSAIASYRRSGTISFSTPGHKSGAGFDPALRGLLGDDLGEADVWLNTADHAAALTAAERLAAGAWGADRTFFLTNGSSAGNQALMLAMVGPGDTVIVGRDLHQSLLTALILTGARPVYLPPRLHPELGVGIGIDPEDLAAALAANPETRLVSVVSPTYWGVTSELQALAAIAHQWDVPFVVDAAWGPHFGFSTALPASALASGADAAITSPHKVLNGLSQAALLHVRGERIDAARVASAVAMTRTTSPLLPILASLDACRRQLAIDGERMLGRVVTLAAGARRRLRAIPGIDLLDADPATRHIVLISKPPAAEVAAKVLARVGTSRKTFTICFIGSSNLKVPVNARFAPTLKAAAEHALGKSVSTEPDHVAPEPRGSRIRGLYAGGTLCAEAQIVLLEAGLTVASNAAVPRARDLDAASRTDAALIDLGSDEYTQGRPHPMIEPAVRDAELARALADPGVGILLVDFVLGYGAHADPAGQFRKAWTSLADSKGALPILIAAITGTPGDPQGFDDQSAKLSAIAMLCPSNADAARLAARLLSGHQRGPRP
mgnify:CR=1 FL=1